MTTQTTPKQPISPHLRQGAARWNWRLHVAASPDSRQLGRVLHLGADDHAWLLGRAFGDDAPGLRLHDSLMSREHVRLLVRAQPATTVGVEDQASTNGTYCNGNRIVRGEAGSGCVLRFGETVAVLEADSGRAPEADASCTGVPGHSEAARLTRAALEAAAHSPMPTLIVGETGTGKEFAASELHRRSGRRGPLVRVNIAALPETLFEAELFGAAAGAYTGAQRARRGRIAEAQGGTLVLDEIGELPLAQQAKLLRVLEEGSLRPLGASADQHFDVRFVASTNADLDRLVEEGRFRPDLLARLRGAVVVLPSLRERRADLLELADVVLPLSLAEGARPQSWRRALPADVVEALLLRPWRYNLRELLAVLHDLRRIVHDPEALAQWLHGPGRRWPPPLGQGASPPELRPQPGRNDADMALSSSSDLAASSPALASAVDGRDWPPRRRRAPKPEAMRALLRRCEGNVEAMARELGCARRQVYRWLEAAEIDQADLDAVREEAR